MKLSTVSRAGKQRNRGEDGETDGGCEEGGEMKGAQQEEKKGCCGAVRSCTDATHRKDDER